MILETATSGVEPARLKALFTTAVWGKAYIDRFLDYSLRTQLSEGNLGAFDHESLFLIVTDAADADYVTSSEAYRTLSRVVSTECVAREKIRGSRSGDKYARLTACQNYALWRSQDYDAIFFGYADALWADGSYRAAAQRLQSGYDAIFSFGYPVDAKPFVAATDSFQSAAPGEPVRIAPRTFAQRTYETLHAMAHSNKFSNTCIGHCPSYVMWDVSGQGILLKGFHYHPVALRVRRDVPRFFAPFRSTLDEEFVARLYRTYPRLYVSESSDEMGVCSLAEESSETFLRHPPQPVSTGALAEFAEAYAGLLHRELFAHTTRLVLADVDEERWRPAEEEAAKVARDVERRLMIPDCILALEAPAAYVARWQRQANFGHMSPYTAKLHRKISEINHSPGFVVRYGLHYSKRIARRALAVMGLEPLIRNHVLSRLTLEQRRRLYEYFSGNANEAPLFRVRRDAGSSNQRWGLWRWFWNWIRVHA